MQSCEEFPSLTFCYCVNVAGESVPQYKQHNSSGNNIGTGYACCNKLNYQPSMISNTHPYNHQQFVDVYSYINLISANDNSCDYTKYYGGKTLAEASIYLRNNYPDLYNYAQISMEIFNKYYTIEAYKNYGIYTSLTDNRDLIPTITETNITCPIENFIPQILSYKEGTKNTDEYLYICFPKDINYPNLSIPYTIYSITNNSNTMGKTNSINTVYSPTAAPNLGQQVHTTKPSKISGIIMGIIIGFFALVSILIAIYIYKKQGKI